MVAFSRPIDSVFHKYIGNLDDFNWRHHVSTAISNKVDAMWKECQGNAKAPKMVDMVSALLKLFVFSILL